MVAQRRVNLMRGRYRKAVCMSRAKKSGRSVIGQRNGAARVCK